MPTGDIFAERHQVNFPIDLHSFAAVGNEQRGIVNIVVLFIDRS